jgi:hypothetical protein
MSKPERFPSPYHREFVGLANVCEDGDLLKELCKPYRLGYCNRSGSANVLKSPTTIFVRRPQRFET